MQFSFLGFSVSKMMELSLDMKDIAILRYFVDFKDTGRMNTEVVEGVTYYWVSYRSMEEEMPYLALGKRAIMTRMLKLRDLGILNHYTKKEGGTFSFFTLGSKYMDLTTVNKASSIEDNESNKVEYKNKLNKNNIEPVNCNDEGVLKYSDYVRNYDYGVLEKGERVSFENAKGCASKGRTKTHLLNNSSTKETNNIKKYIKKEAEEIIEYLNSKINTQYKANSKNTVKLISDRLEEGFTVEDFKTVIDNKFKAWVGTEFEQYLTPFTLFGAKFEQYLNQKVVCSADRQKNNYENYNIYKKYNKYENHNNYERPKLRFDNFKGREYDYDELERKLLGW